MQYIYIYIIIIDRSYIALTSALQLTPCGHVTCDSEWVTVSFCSTFFYYSTIGFFTYRNSRQYTHTGHTPSRWNKQNSEQDYYKMGRKGKRDRKREEEREEKEEETDRHTCGRSCRGSDHQGRYSGKNPGSWRTDRPHDRSQGTAHTRWCLPEQTHT